MADATAGRWRKYGNDRLYVTGPAGEKLGWHDLVTGEDHIEAPDATEAFRSAVSAWRAADDASPVVESAPSAVVEVVEPQLTPPSDPAGPDSPVVCEAPEWEDLASRRAGAMAREQAIALKQAAPVRTLLARVLKVHTDERAWRIGADGEEKVAARLEKLVKKDPRWKFLNAIPVGENGSDIDHLVIGPGGVFTLNSKHHPGGRIWIRGNGFRVNGTQLPYIRNSRHEAARASRYLSTVCGFTVEAAGIVVPVGADSITIKEAPADVYVINRMALVSWLRRRPEVLDDGVVLAIFEAARRSTTWRPGR